MDYLRTLYNMFKKRENDNRVFAKGICWKKMFWVFFISSFIGDLIETVFCRVFEGVWMSRSSVIYGHFSIVWGIGAVVLTLVLSRFIEKPNWYVLGVGALLGGVYEYTCSLFTEVVLGTVFWDYSWMPFHIGGRTNLLYMLFWGILGLFWIRLCYPRLSLMVERIPPLPGNVMTWALVGFMIVNSLISAMAMIRYTQRQDGIEADNVVESFLDETYQDELIEQVWPNMVVMD